MQDKQLTRHNVPHNTVPYASQPTSNKQCTRNKIAPTLLPSGNQTRDRPLKNSNHQIMDTSTILTGQMQKYHSKIYDQTTIDPRTSYHHIYRQPAGIYIIQSQETGNCHYKTRVRISTRRHRKPAQNTYFHNGHPGHSQYLGRPHPTLPRHVDLLHCHLWA